MAIAADSPLIQNYASLHVLLYAYAHKSIPLISAQERSVDLHIGKEKPPSENVKALPRNESPF